MMITHLLSLQPTQASTRPEPQGECPDDYDDFATPDGVDIDHEALERFKAVAQELGLSQDEAQRLVNFYSEQVANLLTQWVSQHESRIGQWQKQSRFDQELAGNGGFDRNLAVAKKAVERFGGDKLSAALNETGAGSHPEVLRCFYRIGKALSEDGFIAPGGKRQKKSYAETFYPDFNH